MIWFVLLILLIICMYSVWESLKFRCSNCGKRNTYFIRNLGGGGKIISEFGCHDCNCVFPVFEDKY